MYLEAVPEASDALREALRRVIDPEVGVNIVDLGLVYAIETTERGVRVQLTMTSPACPLGEGIVAEAESALRACVPRETPVEVILVWDPPWTPERMSDAARSILGWEG
jgi:metal-sulfur cluster biosynthetic enzyme